MNPKNLREVLQEFKDNLDNNFAGDGKCLDRQEKYFGQALLDIERIIVPEKEDCQEGEQYWMWNSVHNVFEYGRKIGKNQAIEDMKARIRE